MQLEEHVEQGCKVGRLKILYLLLVSHYGMDNSESFDLQNIALPFGFILSSNSLPSQDDHSHIQQL